MLEVPNLIGANVYGAAHEQYSRARDGGAEKMPARDKLGDRISGTWSPDSPSGPSWLSLPSPILCSVGLQPQNPGKFSVICLSLPAYVFDQQWMAAFGYRRVAVPTPCATGS